MSAAPARRSLRVMLTVSLGLLLTALVVYAWRYAHIDWSQLGQQLRAVSPWHVALGITAIYAGMILRAWRWRLLMGREAHVFHLTSLLAPQLIGFAAVAVFGRLADLTRPLLTARRTGNTAASQIAVYSLERMLDLGAAATLFSLTLALAPRSTPHYAALVRAGVLSFAATLAIAGLALSLRHAGERIATGIERALRPASQNFAVRASAKTRDFAEGITALKSTRDLALACLLSLVMWLGIAWAYVESMHAFTATPQLAHVSFTQTMLLFATSLGGSLLQLPGLGWFTQIAVLAGSMHLLYGAPTATATACGFVVLAVTTLSVIPLGLVAAQRTGTSLRQAARASEHTEARIAGSI